MVSASGVAFQALPSPGPFLPPFRVPARGGRRASRYLRACRAFLPPPRRRARAAMGLMPAARAFSGCRACPRPPCRLPACCAPAAPGRAGPVRVPRGGSGVLSRERARTRYSGGRLGEHYACALRGQTQSQGSAGLPTPDLEWHWGSGTLACLGTETEARRLLLERAPGVRRWGS